MKSVTVRPSKQMVDMAERAADDVIFSDGEFLPADTHPAKVTSLWKNAITKVVMANNAKKLNQIANRLVRMAINGDLGAIKEVGDRLDGKAVAQIQTAVEAKLIISVQDERL